MPTKPPSNLNPKKRANPKASSEQQQPNPSFTELKYALFHKPTKKWVAFRNAGLELTRTIITLVTFQKATIAAAPNYLIATLKNSSLHKTPYYGKENFLEFDTIKIEVTYTIKQE